MDNERENEAQEATALRRVAFIPEVKEIDLENRTITHLISTDSVDRAGDIIDVEGWDLSRYAKNPVVLVDHDYRVERIIGKGDVSKTKQGLVSTTKFHDFGIGFAAMNLVAEGMARAWSVGFAPTDSHSIRRGRKEKCTKCKKAFDAQLNGRDPDEVWVRGYHFVKQELLEYSLVAVPMNPDAVSEAVQRGVIPKEQVPGLFKITDDEAIEALVNKILSPPQSKAKPEKSAAPEPKAEPETASHQDKYPVLADLLGAACEQIGDTKRERRAREAVRETLSKQ